MFILSVPLRLVNPTCGADWRGENYNTAEFIHSVKLRGVKYHRIHQNYLFGVESAKVTVRFTSSCGWYAISIFSLTYCSTLFSCHM